MRHLQALKDKFRRRSEQLLRVMERLFGWEPMCPECGGPPDDRVLAGMKCGPCAYK